MSAEPNMKELRADAKTLGITIPVGTSKVDAAKLIEAKRAEIAEQDAAAPDAPAAAEPQETPAERPAAKAPAPKAGRVEIVRETAAAWWCPVCDHSQTHGFPACQSCGAVRDGEHVVA